MPATINRTRLFTGCVVALVATAFGFAVRAAILDQWRVEFNLSQEQIGYILGAGLAPFAVSIILFSLDHRPSGQRRVDGDRLHPSRGVGRHHAGGAARARRSRRCARRGACRTAKRLCVALRRDVHLRARERDRRGGRESRDGHALRSGEDEVLQHPARRMARRPRARRSRGDCGRASWTPRACPAASGSGR